MILKKNGVLLPRIKRIFNQKGQINLSVGLFMILFLAILMLAQIQVEQYKQVSLYVEDALAASNLAAAVIDKEAYFATKNMVLTDAEETYARFLEAIKENLSLNDELYSQKIEMISSPVKIERFLIYNVTEAGIDCIERLEGGTYLYDSYEEGEVLSPNLLPIEHTGIYSELSFQIKDVFGIETEVKKEKFVDVVGEMDEENDSWRTF